MKGENPLKVFGTLDEVLKAAMEDLGPPKAIKKRVPKRRKAKR